MGFMDFFKKEPTEPKKEYTVNFNQAKPGKVDNPTRSDQKTSKPDTKCISPFQSDGSIYPLDNNRYGRIEHQKPHESNNWFFPKTFIPKPILEKRTVIMLVIENTAIVNRYNSEVMKLINKIISDNNLALFMFVRLDEENTYFDISDFKKLNTMLLPESLLTTKTCDTNNVKLSDALTYLYDFAEPLGKAPKTVEYEKKKYEIDNIKIIFVGSGCIDNIKDEDRLSSEFLQLLCECKNVKTLKYFCIKDEDTINVAKIGFPVIGHIEPNFYK